MCDCRGHLVVSQDIGIVLNLRYEKQLPGHQVQIDVKFVEPLKTAARHAARN